MTKIKSGFQLLSCAFAVLFFLSACGSSDFQSSIYEKKAPSSQTGAPGKSFFEIGLESGIPERALDQAFKFFDSHKSMITNKNYLSIIDFSKHSGQPRFYIMDLKTGQVDVLLTAHGRGSDENNDGFADRFSNIPQSQMTSLGFYLTAEHYSGKYGISMRLDGLESSNDKARERAVVVHGAPYVDPGRPQMGRSFGCPAVELRLIQSVVNRLDGGSLLYGYHEIFSPKEATTQLSDSRSQ